jgi:DMSO/TMAO reductase YedYZ molybdopterin-dependent catalytic subunit
MVEGEKDGLTDRPGRRKMRDDEVVISERLPPGQVLTQKWPVLSYGETPRADLQTWNFRCFGLVEKEISWTWKDFLELPRVEVTSDIHCVTRWSRFDNRWVGVAVAEILRRAGVGPEAVAVMAHSEG